MPTLNLNANIESRKKLSGIAKNVRRNAVSNAFSANSSILSTEKEIRDTKKVSVLIPFLLGAKKVSDAIAQVKATGSVTSRSAQVGERVLELANELVTEPILWRPRDGETIQASELLARYKDGFSTTATVIKDRAYFRNIMVQGKAGLSTGEKIEIIDTTTTLHNTTKSLEERGKLFAQQIREAKLRIMQHTDAMIQGDFTQSDMILGLAGIAELAIENDAKYNIFNAPAVEKTGQLRLPDAKFDGKIDTHVSKVFNEESIDGILMIKGVAVSQFLFKDYMNNDKTQGLNTYILSLEFNEGTGVYIPQLITVFARTAIHASQSAVGSGALDIMANVENSTVTSTNPDFSATTTAKAGN